MSNIINNYASTIVQIYQDVIGNYERNVDLIKQIEGELNDLNHEIELSSPKNARDGYKMYKEIRELRIKRRQAKEENELMKDMYEYLKGQNAQNFKNKIQQLQGSSMKVREAQEHRIYTPRQRNDLTITNKTSTAYKPFQEMLDEFNKTKISVKNGKLRK